MCFAAALRPGIPGPTSHATRNTCRLGAPSADRAILRDGLELFLQRHVSVDGLAQAVGLNTGTEASAAALRPADLQLRLKAARRALAGVLAEGGGDVFHGD